MSQLPNYVLDAINSNALLLRVFSQELKAKLPYQSSNGAPLVLQLQIAILDGKYVAMCNGAPFIVQPDFALCMTFKEAFRLAFDAFAKPVSANQEEEDLLEDDDADDSLERRFY